MKWTVSWVVSMGLVVGLAAFLFASQKAVKQECIVKTNEAAHMIKQSGLKATLKKLNEKKGPFVWKDSYVFGIEDKTARVLAHPFIPEAMLGRSFKEVTDKKGKPYFKEFLRIAREKGEGWVDYVYPDPKGVLSKKVAYVLKVPGENVILVAGIYAESAKVKLLATLNGKKAALVVSPNGFDDSEYKSLKVSFDRLAIQTVVFASKTGLAKGMHGSRIQTDKKLTDFSVGDFDAVVFIGGRGLEEYLLNPDIHKIAKDMLGENKIVAANYWAPAILANAGVLNGRKATITPIESDVLTKNGAHYTENVLVVDGNIITGNGSATTGLYADLVVARLLINSFR